MKRRQPPISDFLTTRSKRIPLQSTLNIENHDLEDQIKEPVAKLTATKEPAVNLAATKEPAARLAATKKPAAMLYATKEPAAKLAATKEPAMLVATKELVVKLVATKEPAAKLAATNEPAAMLYAIKELAAKLAATKEPAAMLVATKELVVKLVATKVPAAKLVATKEPAAKLVATKEPAAKLVATKEPAERMGNINAKLDVPKKKQRRKNENGSSEVTGERPQKLAATKELVVTTKEPVEMLEATKETDERIGNLNIKLNVPKKKRRSGYIWTKLPTSKEEQTLKIENWPSEITGGTHKLEISKEPHFNIHLKSTPGQSGKTDVDKNKQMSGISEKSKTENFSKKEASLGSKQNNKSLKLPGQNKISLKTPELKEDIYNYGSFLASIGLQNIENLNKSTPEGALLTDVRIPKPLHYRYPSLFSQYKWLEITPDGFLCSICSNVDLGDENCKRFGGDVWVTVPANLVSARGQLSGKCMSHEITKKHIVALENCPGQKYSEYFWKLIGAEEGDGSETSSGDATTNVDFDDSRKIVGENSIQEFKRVAPVSLVGLENSYESER